MTPAKTSTHATMVNPSGRTNAEHVVAYYDDDRGVGDTACGKIITRSWVGPRYDKKVTCKMCLRVVVVEGESR